MERIRWQLTVPGIGVRKLCETTFSIVGQDKNVIGINTADRCQCLEVPGTVHLQLFTSSQYS